MPGSGLRARGAIEVDLTWRDGAGTATLRAIQNGKHVLRVPAGMRVISVTAEGKPVNAQPALLAVAGKTYNVVFSK